MVVLRNPRLSPFILKRTKEEKNEKNKRRTKNNEGFNMR
jgi:hypothetical protein